MKIRPSTYFLLVLASFTLIIFCFSLTYQRLETKLLPLILSGIIFILAIVEIGKEIRGVKILNTSERDKKMNRGNTALLSSYLSVCAWLIGFFTAIYMVGFLIAIPLFIIFYLVYKGKGWTSSVIIAGLTTALTWSGFSLILGVRLYTGVVFELLGMR